MSVEVSNNKYDFTSFFEIYLRVYSNLQIASIDPPIASIYFNESLKISGSGFYS